MKNQSHAMIAAHETSDPVPSPPVAEERSTGTRKMRGMLCPSGPSAPCQKRSSGTSATTSSRPSSAESRGYRANGMCAPRPCRSPSRIVAKDRSRRRRLTISSRHGPRSGSATRSLPSHSVARIRGGGGGAAVQINDLEVGYTVVAHASLAVANWGIHGRDRRSPIRSRPSSGSACGRIGRISAPPVVPLGACVIHGDVHPGNVLIRG